MSDFELHGGTRVRAPFSHAGNEMQRLLKEVDSFVRTKIKSQNGVPTFYDNRLIKLIDAVRSAGAATSSESKPVVAALGEIEKFHSSMRRPRFEEPGTRLGRPEDLVRRSMRPGLSSLLSSQGVTTAPSWAGHL